MPDFESFAKFAKDTSPENVNWALARQDFQGKFDIDNLMFDVGAGHLTPLGKDIQSRFDVLIKQDPFGTSPGGGRLNAFEKIRKEFGVSDVQIYKSLDQESFITAQALLGGFGKGFTAGALEADEAFKEEAPISATIGELGGMVLPISKISKGISVATKAIPKFAKLPGLVKAGVESFLAGGILETTEQAVELTKGKREEFEASKILQEGAVWAGIGVTFNVLGKGVQSFLKKRGQIGDAKALKTELELFGAPERPLSDYKDFIIKQKGKPVETLVKVGGKLKPTELSQRVKFGQPIPERIAEINRNMAIEEGLLKQKTVSGMPFEQVQKPRIRKVHGLTLTEKGNILLGVKPKKPDRIAKVATEVFDKNDHIKNVDDIINFGSGPDVTLVFNQLKGKLSDTTVGKIIRTVFSRGKERLKTSFGRQLAEQMEDVRADQFGVNGEFLTRYRGTGKWFKSELLVDVIGKELAGQPGGRFAKETPQKIKEIAGEVRGILDDILNTFINVGGKVVETSGKVRTPNRIKNYIPRRIKDNIIDTIFGDVEKAVANVKRLFGEAATSSDKKIIQILDSKVKGRAVLNKKTEQSIRKIMKDENVTFGDALLRLKRFTNNEKYNPFGNIEKARTLELPSEFYETNIGRLIPAYIKGASRAIAEVKAWGPQRKGFLDDLAKLRDESLSDHAIVNDMFELSTGLWEKTHPLDSGVKKAINAFMNYEVITKIGLGTASIPNLVQTLISTGVKAPWNRIIRGGFKYLTNKRFRDAVRSSGATVAEAQQMLTGTEAVGPLADLTSRILTPFTMINRANKAIAASTARNWIPSLMKSARGRGIRAGVAKRHLKSLGIDHAKPLTEKELRKGMFRFASDVQLQKDIFKEPIWMNTNLRPFALFKRFGYRHFNLIRDEGIREWKHGNPMPLLRLAAGGFLGGLFVTEAKDILKEIISGKPYRKKHLPTYQKMLNIYAAAGAMGWASDLTRLYNDNPRLRRGEFLKNIGFNLTPLAVGEAFELGAGIVNVSKSKEPGEQAIKELLGQTPLARMAIKKKTRSKKSGRAF